MSQEPLVSVITLSYNTGKYVVRALESVKNQTYKNIECIIIDDTSSDDSVQLIEHWLSSNNSKAKFIKHESNKGVCLTLNEAIAACSGKYITWAGDDILYPETIAKQVEAFESGGESVGVVCGNAHVIDLDDNITGTFFKEDFQFPNDPYITLLRLDKVFILSPTTMVRKAVYDDIGLCDPNFFQEDYYMWLRIAKHYKILYINQLLCGYRDRPDSFGRNSIYKKKLWEGMIKVLEQMQPENDNEKHALDAGFLRLVERYYYDYFYKYPGFSTGELKKTLRNAKFESIPFLYKSILSMSIYLNIPYKYFFKFKRWFRLQA